MTEDRTAPDSMKRLARVTGLLYLVIIVCAGFSEGFVRETLIVPGDAAVTVGNIVASEGLFRLGFAADLLAFVADAAVSVLLYILLKPVNRTLALLAAAFRLVAHPAIASVNLLHHFAVLLLLGGAPWTTAFDAEQLQALTMFSLELHGYGYLIGGVFFGVHLAILGHLLFHSEGRFPRILGLLVAAAAVGYLVESFTFFLAPDFEAVATTLVIVTAAVAELSLCGWLIVKGIRAPGDSAHV